MEVTDTFRIPNNLPLREVTPFYKILNLAYYALSSNFEVADFLSFLYLSDKLAADF